ncbi:hypothetical protein D3C85_1678550 [compost metagenome]
MDGMEIGSLIIPGNEFVIMYSFAAESDVFGVAVDRNILLFLILSIVMFSQ